uniref:Uncharacterized protein n=1 Tax=Tanacetum cinerariifolium TaxID=118510 RepID=A0A6L2M080_TANCI|nr:hypothetical protein [Tanacetum cinerariifolium]
MPKSIHIDHHNTAIHIPMYHRTHNLTNREREIYKSLKRRLFNEGRVIDPSYLGDQPNLRPIFAAIGFDYLLDMDEKICLGVFMYTPKWPISSLKNGMDSNPDIYPPPHKEYLLIRDALFNQRLLSKTRKEENHWSSSKPKGCSTVLAISSLTLGRRRSEGVLQGLCAQ